jgi:hypothetical protein
MALAFDANQIGPLSQLSIGVEDLSMCHQMATGLDGWWKARERTTSLVDVFANRGGTLIQTSSFDYKG